MIRGLIISGHRYQYEFFVKKYGFKEEEFPELISLKQLKTNSLVITYGTYWLNPLYKGVIKCLEKRKITLI